MINDKRQRNRDAAAEADNRRRQVDRRRRPTPMFSRFTLRGRRTRIRRDADLGRGRYIDRSTGRHLALIVLLMVFITLDALSTLHILDQGGNEVNPLMENALQRGVGWFLMIKLVPLPVAFLLLSIHRYFRWVRWALLALVAVYGSLALYHVSLLLRIH